MNDKGSFPFATIHGYLFDFFSRFNNALEEQISITDESVLLEVMQRATYAMKGLFARLFPVGDPISLRKEGEIREDIRKGIDELIQQCFSESEKDVKQWFFSKGFGSSSATGEKNDCWVGFHFWNYPMSLDQGNTRVLYVIGDQYKSQELIQLMTLYRAEPMTLIQLAHAVESLSRSQANDRDGIKYNPNWLCLCQFANEEEKNLFTKDTNHEYLSFTPSELEAAQLSWVQLVRSNPTEFESCRDLKRKECLQSGRNHPLFQRTKDYIEARLQRELNDEQVCTFFESSLIYDFKYWYVFPGQLFETSSIGGFAISLHTPLTRNEINEFRLLSNRICTEFALLEYKWWTKLDKQKRKQRDEENKRVAHWEEISAQLLRASQYFYAPPRSLALNTLNATAKKYAFFQLLLGRIINTQIYQSRFFNSARKQGLELTEREMDLRYLEPFTDFWKDRGLNRKGFITFWKDPSLIEKAQIWENQRKNIVWMTASFWSEIERDRIFAEVINYDSETIRQTQADWDGRLTVKECWNGIWKLYLKLTKYFIDNVGLTWNALLASDRAPKKEVIEFHCGSSDLAQSLEWKQGKLGGVVISGEMEQTLMGDRLCQLMERYLVQLKKDGRICYKADSENWEDISDILEAMEKIREVFPKETKLETHIEQYLQLVKEKGSSDSARLDLIEAIRQEIENIKKTVNEQALKDKKNRLRLLTVSIIDYFLKKTQTIISGEHALILVQSLLIWRRHFGYNHLYSFPISVPRVHTCILTLCTEEELFDEEKTALRTVADRVLLPQMSQDQEVQARRGEWHSIANAMAHSLRKPFNLTIGWAEQLLEDQAFPSEYATKLQEIKHVSLDGNEIVQFFDMWRRPEDVRVEYKKLENLQSVGAIVQRIERLNRETREYGKVAPDVARFNEQLLTSVKLENNFEAYRHDSSCKVQIHPTIFDIVIGEQLINLYRYASQPPIKCWLEKNCTTGWLWIHFQNPIREQFRVTWETWKVIKGEQSIPPEISTKHLGMLLNRALLEEMLDWQYLLDLTEQENCIFHTQIGIPIPKQPRSEV